ncbi:MAG: ornithine cyclodeaminase [Pyrinomonadaceae bacterium]|nr:ornithine cyclodeaminase [Pyrinomonadaceae bacterium]
MLVISKEEVKSLLPVAEAISCVGKAYSELSSGTAKVPDRLGIETEKGITLVMPGHLSVEDALAVKIVSVFPENQSKNKPAIYGAVTVLDPSDGRPLALIEGAYLTALRTGASCGFATGLLAREDAKTLTMIGLGAQSRTIVPAVCAVRSIEKVYAYDPDGVVAESFETEMGGEVSVELVDQTGTAVSESDIVCTATTSQQPVFDGAKLKAGTHVNGIGSFRPDMQEVDLEVIKRASKVVVDTISGAMSEAGDLIQAIDAGVFSEDEIHAEIGSIVSGEKVGRENDGEITFFKSVGNAALDIAVANEVLKRALDRSVGTEVDLG